MNIEFKIVCQPANSVVGAPNGRWAMLSMAEIPRLTVVTTAKSGQQGL